MNLLLCLAIGVLFGAGVYCLLQRSLVRLVVGLVLCGQAANLAVFASAGLVAGAPALVAPGETAPAPGSADPLPQALVLTAIVIGFGLTVFAMALVHRVRGSTGHDDIDNLNRTDAL